MPVKLASLETLAKSAAVLLAAVPGLGAFLDKLPMLPEHRGSFIAASSAASFITVVYLLSNWKRLQTVSQRKALLRTGILAVGVVLGYFTLVYIDQARVVSF